MLDAEDKQAVQKAFSAYEMALRLDPSNAEAHHQLALLLQWKGQFQESLDHVNRLPAGDQSKKSVAILICADEAALGNTELALQTAARLLRDPELEEEDIVAILPVIESRNEIVTLRILEGIQARGLSTEKTLPHLAALYERRGYLQGARETYEIAARGLPASAQILQDLARVAWKQKDYEGTLGYLGHARDLEPNNAAIHFLFAIACNEMNLPVEARKSLEKALQFEPDNPYYNYAMGCVQLQNSDKAQAIPFLKKFVALRPSDPRGHLALATAYLALYQAEAAKAELVLPLKDSRTRPGAEYLLGRLAEQQDDTTGAIAHFRELLKLEPKSPEGHAELGSLLLENQETDAARRETEVALGLEPENYLANRTLLKLYQLAGDARVEEQSERLQKLIENRDVRLRLPQRTIDVRPW